MALDDITIDPSMLPPNLRRLAPLPDAGVAPVLPSGPVMNAPLPRLADAATPSISVVPTTRELTRNAIGADRSELNRLQSTGSGIDQLFRPADGSQPSAGRRTLGVLGRIGDIAAGVLAPGVERLIPGGEGNHNRLIAQEQQRLGKDLGADQQQAQTEQQRALTNYTLQRPDIEQSKIDQKQTAVQERVAQLARNRGENVTWGDDGLPTFMPDPTSPEFQEHQSTTAIHNANAQLSKVNAEIREKHYIPGTPEWEEAQKKIALAQQARAQAGVALGLRAQGVGMRREQLDANLYGTGPDGQPLPGAAQIVGDNGQTQTVGLRAANTAIKQQKGVGTFNDLVGSVDTSRKALEDLHNSGGSFADAQMIAAMNDPHSMVGKYVNGQLVKGNLNDKQIEALGAVNQLREQIGILRASTGGTAAEAQAQRMLDTLPTAGDSPAIVRNKLKQIDGVLQRLSPSVTGVRGGLSVGARPNTSTSSGGSIPSEVAAQLQEGVEHTFGNGQVWTKQSGKPVRIR